MTELLVGTKKGLFVLEGEPGDAFEVNDARVRRRAGRVRDARPAHGPHPGHDDVPVLRPEDLLHRRSDGEWAQASGVQLPEGGEQALERIWVIVPGEDGTLYAGGDPGVLFESRDGGASWELNRTLWEHPTRPDWQPGGGGLCLHSIAPWPGEPDKLALGDVRRRRVADRGRRRDLEPRQRGHPGALPARGRAARRSTLCVHDLQRAPKRPERLFMQFHGGVYRSDDAGRSWTNIGDGLPSRLRLPARRRPRRSRQRVRDPAQGRHGPRHAGGPRARVRDPRRRRDAGRRAATGCPAEHAYLTVLREAFDRRGEGEALELYFGATSGDVFGSADAGATWFSAATRLPPVFSVRAG